ncbi:MAG: DUF2207 domain-containing protein, partial [Propionibacteriales bacterium]|nr:DUF2207 domain-containing protein [Propionibacteriales bacterium]
MRRMVSVIAALMIALSWVLMTPAVSRADSSDDSIKDFQVAASVGKDGVTTVHLDIAFDFGADSGHGLYLAFPLQQAIENDPDHWRMYDYTLGAVTSSSGANTEISSEESDGNLIIRVGSEYRTFTGTQNYQVDYTVRGLVAPNNASSGLDEFNWDVVGRGWQVPIGKVSVAITGPAAITQTVCFINGSPSTPCTATTADDRATFAATGVGNGASVQVVAGFPAGTFVGAEPRYTKRLTPENMFPVNAFTGSVTALLAGGGLFLLWRRTRRAARDQVYLGLTPGLAPAAGQQGTIGYDNAKAPVTVAFTPPRGARPGEIGTLIDATADQRDITATMVDLAVRKHLTIEQTGKKDFTFTLTQGTDELAGYEAKMISKLFSGGGQVTTADLRDSSYAGMLTEIRSSMYDRVTKELHWFVGNPALARGLAIAGAVVLVAAGVGLGLLLGQFGWGLVGLALIVVGIGVLIRNNSFGRRTADGSAVLAQAKGFELYLTTAEAEQIKFEEGIDVFSRYLPYAMVFGVAERWT